VALDLNWRRRRRRFDDQHELAAVSIRIGRKPCRGITQSDAVDRLEALGELARDDKLALRPERRGESVERGRNPVRRWCER